MQKYFYLPSQNNSKEGQIFLLPVTFNPTWYYLQCKGQMSWITSASVSKQLKTKHHQVPKSTHNRLCWLLVPRVSPGLRESVTSKTRWSHAYTWQLLKWTVLSATVCSPQQGEWAAFTLSCSFGLILNIWGSKSTTRKAKSFACFFICE